LCGQSSISVAISTVARVLTAAKGHEVNMFSTGINVGIGAIVVICVVIFAFCFRKRLIKCVNECKMKEQPSIIDASRVRVRVAQGEVSETMC
jgi:uncharacterized membrane protein